VNLAKYTRELKQRKARRCKKKSFRKVVKEVNYGNKKMSDLRKMDILSETAKRGLSNAKKYSAGIESFPYWRCNKSFFKI
jgi:hypothetical protein